MAASLIAAAFLAAIVVTIFLVDTGRTNPVFDAVRAIRHADKVCHFAIFGVLTWFVNRALANRRMTAWGRRLPLGSVIVFVVVTLEELSQHYLDTRTLDAFDWFADVAGILLFTWVSLRTKQSPLAPTNTEA